ncbi:MAG: hypothetical protein AAGJ51_13915, partial [Pseudomonadota bacterium]
MSNDSALFEDDFDMEFEDDFDSALATVLDEEPDDIEQPEAVDLDAPMKELDDFDPSSDLSDSVPMMISDNDEGGYRAIPAIAAMA